MARTPKVSNILLYKLSKKDAEEINRRRISRPEIHDRIIAQTWCIGAQAHMGSYAYAGDVFPLVVVRVFANEWGPGNYGVNGQVLLDGNDTLWVTSVPEFGKLPDFVVEYSGGYFLYPEE